MSWSFGGALVTTVMALPVMGIGAAHAQEFQGPLWGSGGGTSSYNLDCGSTGVMVGLFGKTDLWVDQIGIRCQKVNSDGTLGSAYTKGAVGGSGGTGADKPCPSGKVLSGMDSWSGAYIDTVGASCCKWSASSRRTDRGDCSVILLGVINSFAVATNKMNARVWCPIEKVAKAIRGKYGWYIDSLRFVCDDYNK